MDELSSVTERFLSTARQEHYHGDIVRVLFVVAATLMFFAEFSGANLPFSSAVSIFIIVLLVVTAGLTNPVQMWVQWMNTGISAFGLLLFGGVALAHFRGGNDFFGNGIFVALLSITFLLALYFATRTLRALILYGMPPNIQD